MTRTALMRIALTIRNQTAEAFADELGISTVHLYVVAKRPKESARVDAAINALLAAELPKLKRVSVPRIKEAA